VEGFGINTGALLLSGNVEEVNCVKAKLRQVDLIFHLPVPGESRDWRQVTVQVSLLHGKLDVTFSLSGGEAQEPIPEAVIEGLREAVDWARKNVKAKDLVEMDPEESESE
jgi:hypothetical protein